MNKDKKRMTESILDHALEILCLLTGEASLFQHLTNSLIEMDKEMTEKILIHALKIVYLLPGEEYTIVKKNSPHHSIHQLAGELCATSHTKNEKKITERILNHTLKITNLLTGEVSLMQHFINSLIMIEKDKARKMSERIFSHALDIISLLTGEEYTILKMNSPSSSIHQLYGQCDMDGHKQNHRPFRTLGTSANRSSGLQDDNMDPVSEEGGDEIDGKNAAQLTIPSNICAMSHDDILCCEPKNEEREDEIEEKHIQHIEIHSDINAAESLDRLNCEQNGTGDITKINRDEFHFNGNETVIHLTKKFTCNECGKCFNHQSHLTMHQRVHTGEKPFACPQCGKYFSRKSAVVIHQSVHTGEKPFPCSECGKCFSQMAGLVKHMKIHTGEKPFTCSYCVKCFRQKSELVAHQRIHTGEKPYACSHCGKCFRQKSELVMHQRIHTGNKPFECPQCGKCFSRKCILKQHLKVHR